MAETAEDHQSEKREREEEEEEENEAKRLKDELFENEGETDNVAEQTGESEAKENGENGAEEASESHTEPKEEANGESSQAATSALLKTPAVPSGPVFVDLESIGKQKADAVFTVTMDVPNDMVGRIIGREGSTVRIIQNLSATHLDIPQECAPGSSTRSIKISGTPSHILYCKAIIEAKICNGEDSGIPIPVGDQVDPNMPIVSKLVQVPNDQVGRLIGKSGCTIRQMQEVSGAHVEIAKTCAAGSTMRDVTLIGSEPQVLRAEQLVTQKLAGQPLIPGGAAPGTWSGELLVKINLTSEAMANFSATADSAIRDLQHTGATVDLVKGADGRAHELSLRGDQSKLTMCCSLLQTRFLDNPQGLGEIQSAFSYAAPAPAAAPLMQHYQTHAAPAAAAAYGGYPATAGYPGAYAAQTQQQYPGYDAATAAYYQQYYAAAAAQQQQQAYPQQAYAQQQQNPYAAYYASMGMAAPAAQTSAGGRSTSTLNVPNDLVGRIIGKGGVSIKQIQEQSGAHVDIPPDTKTPTRLLTITGDPQQVAACTQLISQKLVTRF